MDLENLFRKSLKNFSSYEPGEQPQEDGWVKLNTNENPYPPISEVIADLKKAVDDNETLRKYPDSLALEVRKAILNQLLLDKDTLTDRNTVFIGNGSDDVLDTIFKVFIEPEDHVVIFYPSYDMYRVLANLYGAKVEEVKLNDDFSVPTSAFNMEGKLMFVNSPNNPNGKSFDNITILKLCENFKGIVVVDESYADFSEFTSLPLLKKVKNLIVVKSFSKSFSLASLRLGYALADSIIVKEMNKVKLPFNTNYLAQIAAISSITHRRKIFEQNEKIISERKRLSIELAKFKGITVLPSDANFLFIKFEDKAMTLKFLWDLKELKILIRHFSKPNLYNYLRVTIGTPNENNKFLSAFTQIAKKYL
jgi:histidinol-phosphate aminotransferase